MTRYSRWLSVLVVLAALIVAPNAVVAQDFPSQSGGFPSQSGGAQTEPGGFPSQQGTQPPAGRGGFFQSQDYSFSMQWGPQWVLVEQGGGGGAGYEGISLENGTSFVTIMAVTTNEIPQDIVTTVANGAEIPMRFDTVIFDEPTRAAAYYVSQDREIGMFIDAFEVDFSSSLVVLWAFPLAQHDTQLDAFLELMEGLRF